MSETYFTSHKYMILVKNLHLGSPQTSKFTSLKALVKPLRMIFSGIALTQLYHLNRQPNLLFVNLNMLGMWDITLTKILVLKKNIVICVQWRLIFRSENRPLQATTAYTKIIPFPVFILRNVPTPIQIQTLMSYQQ